MVSRVRGWRAWLQPEWVAPLMLTCPSLGGGVGREIRGTGIGGKGQEVIECMGIVIGGIGGQNRECMELDEVQE